MHSEFAPSSPHSPAAPLGTRYLHNFVRRFALFQQPLAARLERTRRADADTLAAEDAGRVRHGLVEESADLRLEAAAIEVERKGILCILGSHLHATPAEHAFGVIAHIHGIVIDQRWVASLGSREAIVIDAIVVHLHLNLWRFREIDG